MPSAGSATHSGSLGMAGVLGFGFSLPQNLRLVAIANGAASLSTASALTRSAASLSPTAPSGSQFHY
jgi:hypothetical protein